MTMTKVIGDISSYWKIRHKLGRNIVLWSSSPFLRPHRLLAAYTGFCATPDFLIIGTQKGGTTSLHNYLLKHPLVKGPLRKEVHFFDLNYEKGAAWYMAHFPMRKRFDDFVTGEASPYYLFEPQAPKRVAKILPDVRLIVLLRNPIDRAYSHYQHRVKRGRESLSFDEVVDRELDLIQRGEYPLTAHDLKNNIDIRHESFLARGIYADQLERWMKEFDKEQFLIMRSEDLFNKPSLVVEQAFEFLDLPTFELPDYPILNRGSYSALDDRMRARLQEFFAPHNARLSDILDSDFSDWS